MFAHIPASERSDLIAEEAMAKRLGISPKALYRWSTQDGCKALGGKKLRAFPENGKRYYRLSDAESIEAIPLLTNGGIRNEQGEQMLCEEEAIGRFGHWCARLSSRGLAWLGRAIRPKEILVRDNSSHNGTFYSRFLRLAFYALSDLEKIEADRTTGRSRSEDPWPSFAEAQAQGYSEDKLKRWRREGKVQTRPGNRLVRGAGGVEQWNTVTEYRPDDLKMAKATEEATRQGKPGYIPTEAAVAHPFWFKHTTLTRWATDGCPYLSGGRRLNSYQDKATGHWFHPQEELEAILRCCTAQPGDPHIDPDGSVWLPTSVVEREHGILIQTLNEMRWRRERSRRRKGPGGRRLHAPSISSKVIPRPGKKIPGGRLRVWNKDDVLRYVAWRNGQAGGAESVAATVTQPTGGGQGDRLARPECITPPPVEEAEPDLDSHTQPKRRGRKKGWRNPEARKRDADMLRAWQTGAYKNAVELAREFKVDPSYARKVLREGGARAGK